MRSSASKHLLFVDDEPSIRATLPSVLQQNGFRVRTVASVPEAIEEISSKTFDVLLCDLNISQPRDGYAVVEAMRRANPKAVTIILTGYPELDNALEGIHHKIDEYLVKPADLDKLLAVLRDELSRRRPKARILSVSYDELLLRTRHMLLEREGYEVVSAAGFGASLQKCGEGEYDLFVLGHSIPQSDKQELIATFRRSCLGPIISLRRNTGEQLVSADYHIEPDPEPLVKLIANIVSGKKAES